MRQRKNVENLSAQEQQLLRDAFGTLRASGEYSRWASIHAQVCPHTCGLFLPWHRAFIFGFENALRAAVQSDTLALPYWDWMGTREIPALFADPNNNPLWAQRYTDQDRPDDVKLPAQADVDNITAEPYFADFGGIGGCASSGRAQLADIKTPHDDVHFWVGFAMADPVGAACDPIFWVHHANVDRIWANWQKAHPGEDPECLDTALAGVGLNLTVRDVLNIGGPSLGYEYVEQVHVLAMEREFLLPESFGAPVPDFRLPERFTKAELRLEGVHALPDGPVPSEIRIYLTGHDRVGRVTLFGFHPRGRHMRMGPAPCFDPVEHDSPCPNESDVRLDVTEALRCLAKDEPPNFRFALSSATGAPRDELRLGIRRIVLAFPS